MCLRTRIALGFVAALCIVSGCVPSKHPLSDEKTSKVDQRLVGRWVIEGDEKKDSLMVVTQKEGQNGLEITSGDDGDEDSAVAFATTIGDHHYLSAGDKEDDPEEIEYQIVLYEFADNDTLKVYSLDQQVIEKAIADGTLTGVVETKREGFIFTHIERTAKMITDSPAYLKAFLKKRGKDCFLDDDYIITYIRQPESNGNSRDQK